MGLFKSLGALESLQELVSSEVSFCTVWLGWSNVSSETLACFESGKLFISLLGNSEMAGITLLGLKKK